MSDALEILAPGFLSSVQDKGRRLCTHLGLSPSGAADPLALRLGNQLVGNDEGAAAIEMTLEGANVRFLKTSWVAFTGAECDPRLEGQTMPMWFSFLVKAGEIVSAGSMAHGARSYLCVNGGIEAPIRFGSRSTDLGSGWGGPFGRELRSGDRLSLAGEAKNQGGYRRTRYRVRELYDWLATGLSEINVTRGTQWDWFDANSQQKVLTEEFEVSTHANRKGLRINGPELLQSFAQELTTEGVSAGALQVPAGGQPLLLFCEQQTTGGYPKIINVTRADRYKLGQLRPGTRIRFRESSFENAWAALEQLERLCHQSTLPV